MAGMDLFRARRFSHSLQRGDSSRHGRLLHLRASEQQMTTTAVRRADRTPEGHASPAILGSALHASAVVRGAALHTRQPSLYHHEETGLDLKNKARKGVQSTLRHTS